MANSRGWRWGGQRDRNQSRIKDPKVMSKGKARQPRSCKNLKKKKRKRKRCVEKTRQEGRVEESKGEVGWVIGQSDDRDAKNQNQSEEFEPSRFKKKKKKIKMELITLKNIIDLLLVN